MMGSLQFFSLKLKQRHIQFKALLLFTVSITGLLFYGTVKVSADGPSEVYFFNNLGIANSDKFENFKDRHPGNDLLPYTSDDIPLPERGNVGGTWGGSHLDLNSDGEITDDEAIFSIIRFAGGDTVSFSSMTHTELGVLYESEDWADYHEARNEGPSHRVIGDIEAEGSDFEHNDRPHWEDESNAYLFNNFRENQHGKGKPKYYFENINPEHPEASEEPFIYDEIEGYSKPLNFQHNYDDPDDEFNQRGDCRKDYMLTFKSVIKGYLIPVEELSSLEDHSLPSLFNWEAEGFDLAKYLREEIAPRLDSEDLELDHLKAEEANLLVDDLLPITHLMLMQIESPIELNLRGRCDLETAKMQARYWGIEEPENVTYRVSHLLGYNDNLREILFEGPVRPFMTKIVEEDARNIWLLDHFYRDEPSHLGRYEFFPSDKPWAIEPGTDGTFIDLNQNHVFKSPDELASTLTAPLPKSLSIEEAPIELVADVASNSENWELKLAFLMGDEVIAQAQLDKEQSSLRLGGSLKEGGEITLGPGIDHTVGEGLSYEASDIGFYTRIIFSITPEGISLHRLEHDSYEPNSFLGLVRGEEAQELAFLPFGENLEIEAIDRIAIRTNDQGVVSHLAVLAAPAKPTSEDPVLSRPGDCNADGLLDMSDTVCLLAHLFLGGKLQLPCGDGTTQDASNISLLDSNDDQLVDMSDSIYVLSYLFLGSSPPALGEECAVIPGCQLECLDAP